MARDKGLIWVDGIGGGYRPVPKSCPKCGRPTVRGGNRDYRGVACVDRQQRLVDGKLIQGTCDWRETVYHETAAKVRPAYDV